MNKLAKDRFIPHGPLIAENYELFSISGNQTFIIDEAPIPPETHYSQAIPVSMINPKSVYTLPTDLGETGVQYDYANKVANVNMNVIRSWFTPNSF
jgi:nitrous-oxide reductase